MLKINENKTLKELREKGFVFRSYELLYEIKKGVYLAFNMNDLDEDYLYYIGEECYILVNQNEYEEERLKAIEDLKEGGFVIDEKTNI